VRAPEDAGFYSRALLRIDRVSLLAAAGGIVIAGFLASWPGALGFALGAGAALINYRLWKRVANAVGASARPPRSASAVLMGLRYLLFGAIIFVIIKYFGVSLPAVLAGLLVPVAAIIIEILYELFT
jgi:hypothetical protein